MLLLHEKIEGQLKKDYLNGNRELFSSFSVMQTLTNGEHYTFAYNFSKVEYTFCPQGADIVTLWEIGTYSFTTVRGSRRTVKKYTYSRDKAIEYLKGQGKL